MKNVRVSFDVIDVWDRGDFRNFIKTLQDNTESIFNFELYIISQASSEDSVNEDYINKVGDTLDIDSSRVIYCVNFQEKLDALDDNNIDIHFDSNEQNVIDILDDSIGTFPIQVIQRVNENALLYYIQSFYRELKQINE
jgi:hypothetical protein